MSFRKELEEVINRYSQENGSNTPDFILAAFLCNCLIAFDSAVNARTKWYGGKPAWRGEIPPVEMDWPPPEPVKPDPMTWESLDDYYLESMKYAGALGTIPL